jgi:hypothetical protein
VHTFSVDPGLILWAVLAFVFVAAVIVGVVFAVRYFVRLNRRVDDLSRAAATAAEGRQRRGDTKA